MKVVFAGTPEFAGSALAAILKAGFDVPLVLTQPDRPAGRGMKLQASDVKCLALEHGLPVEQPRGLRLDGRFAEDAARARTAMESVQPDVMVVAAYGLILPQWVLDTPRMGCVNIHASLLPRWRGAAPIHRAIEAGDAETGITLMQMDAGLDTGDMLSVERLTIAPDDTTATLHDRLAPLGARMVVDALRYMATSVLLRTPQPVDGVLYAEKIRKAESLIDWSLPAEQIARRVRALTPAPGASTMFGDYSVKVICCEIDSEKVLLGKRAGRISSIDKHGISVACGAGALRLTRLQRAGGKPMAAAELARGLSIKPGMSLGGIRAAGSDS